jgi:hypothetical protein
MKSTGVADTLVRRGSVEISVADVERLFAAISAKPYEEIEPLFSRNPRFMRGADKLLIIVLAACEALRPKHVVATNESVARELGRLTLHAETELESLGLYPTSLA